MGTTSAPLDTTLGLETPEHVAFEYQLAGPAARLGAYLLDLLLRGVVLFLTALLVAYSGGDVFSDVFGFEVGVLLLVFFVLEWGYFVFCELLMAGASPGKRAFRLRVVRDDGLPVGPIDSLLRNLLRAADLLPTLYAFGALAMLVDRKFRRLGDLVAGTIVVVEPPVELRARARPRAVERLAGLPPRPTLRKEEQAALALFHRRAPELSESRARELAEIWAPTLRARFGLPDADALLLLEALHERVEGS